MTIIVESRRISKANLSSRYPAAIIIDTTSRGSLPYRKLSPFYPHKNIPVPFSEGQYAFSVEGIWQGLKVFNNYGIDTSKFYIDTMVGIKRSSKKYGEILGHQKGINGHDILDYTTAKQEIYISSYLWVLKNYLQKELASIAQIATQSTIVFLDYNTSANPLDPVKPISHATLCKLYLEETIAS